MANNKTNENKQVKKAVKKTAKKAAKKALKNRGVQIALIVLVVLFKPIFSFAQSLLSGKLESNVTGPCQFSFTEFSL